MCAPSMRPCIFIWTCAYVCRYKFLLYRFTPDKYWWGVVILARCVDGSMCMHCEDGYGAVSSVCRNMLLTLAAVIFPSDGYAQVGLWLLRTHRGHMDVRIRMQVYYTAAVLIVSVVMQVRTLRLHTRQQQTRSSTHTHAHAGVSHALSRPAQQLPGHDPHHEYGHPSISPSDHTHMHVFTLCVCAVTLFIIVVGVFFIDSQDRKPEAYAIVLTVSVALAVFAVLVRTDGRMCRGMDTDVYTGDDWFVSV